MKWIDYRKALKIGFDDADKAEMLSNKISVYLDREQDHLEREYEKTICRDYFIEVCENGGIYYRLYEVKESITNEKDDMARLISKAVAFVNVCKRYDHVGCGMNTEKALMQFLNELNIRYSTNEDKDGIFVFPEGASELDEGNVSIPFEWLKDYPLARAEMRKALESYQGRGDCSTTADLFRKTLETFGQEFFKTNKSLENMKSDFGSFMKEKDIPKELSSNFETLLQTYANYMNNYAKHRDGTAEKYLEFIMYHTGNIIRFMITLKKTN